MSEQQFVRKERTNAASQGRTRFQPDRQRQHRFAANVDAYMTGAEQTPLVTDSPHQRRHLLLFVGLAVLSIFVIILSLSWSSVRIPFDDVVRILAGQEVTQGSRKTIVMDIRLPRVITAMLVGMALGLAGLQMQTIFRNPLAEPFTLGVSSGASLGVALVILAAPGSGVGFAALVVRH